MAECCCHQKPNPTNFLEFILNSLTCPARLQSMVVGVGIVGAGITTMFTKIFQSIYSALSKNETSIISPLYELFALTSDEAKSKYKMFDIPTTSVMVGNDQNNILIADPNGSKIWAKNGLNFMVAGEGHDTFYFSLCSTKIIDNKVSVIKNFDQNNDKLKFFCTKYEIQPNDILIQHHDDSTCIEVKGATDTSAICLLNNVDIHPSDIIITTLGDVQQDLVI
jgi:hypothetical protein